MPWEKSTGPKTPDGKKKSAMRSFKGGQRPLLRTLSKALVQQQQFLWQYQTDREAFSGTGVGKKQVMAP